MESPKYYLQTASRLLMKGMAGLLLAVVQAIKSMPSQVREGFHEAWLGLRSHDRPTRRMSLIFYASLIGVALTAYSFGKYTVARRERARIAAQAEEARLAEEKAKAEELRRSREPPPYQSLGTFTLEIRAQEGVARSSGLSSVEIEIVVSCSGPEVCEWVGSHIDVSRGELSPLFTASERDKILSVPGKKAFREEIRDALNRVLEERGVKGTILEVLFPRFIAS